MAKRWMQRAVKREGALSSKAKEAGQSPMAYARSHAHSPGLTGQQARFALVAQHESVPKKSRREALYDRSHHKG